MIRIGILEDPASIKDSARIIDQIRELKIINAAFNSTTDEDLLSSAKKIICASDAIYFGIDRPASGLIKQIIRSGMNIYFADIPDLNIKEAEELKNLESEAGCVSQIFNPYIFDPVNFKQSDKVQPPFLINAQLSPVPGVGIKGQIIRLLLFIDSLDDSISPKIEVYSLEGEKESYVMDLNLSFYSGSLAHIVISPQIKGEESQLNLFRKEGGKISLNIKQTQKGERVLTSLENFVNAISGKPAVRISIDKLFLATQIVEEIKGKLKLRGSLLL